MEGGREGGGGTLNSITTPALSNSLSLLLYLAFGHFVGAVTAGREPTSFQGLGHEERSWGKEVA